MFRTATQRRNYFPRRQLGRHETTLFEDATEFAALSDDLGPGTAVLRNFARNREALIMPSRGAVDKRSGDSGLRTVPSPLRLVRARPDPV